MLGLTPTIILFSVKFVQVLSYAKERGRLATASVSYLSEFGLLARAVGTSAAGGIAGGAGIAAAVAVIVGHDRSND